jgi:hypothetical protein
MHIGIDTFSPRRIRLSAGVPVTDGYCNVLAEITNKDNLNNPSS